MRWSSKWLDWTPTVDGKYLFSFLSIFQTSRNFVHSGNQPTKLETMLDFCTSLFMKIVISLIRSFGRIFSEGNQIQDYFSFSTTNTFSVLCCNILICNSIYINIYAGCPNKTEQPTLKTFLVWKQKAAKTIEGELSMISCLVKLLFQI